MACGMGTDRRKRRARGMAGSGGDLGGRSFLRKRTTRKKRWTKKDERDAAGVATGSTDSGPGAGEGDLRWVRNGDSDRAFRCTDRLRMRPRSSASAPAFTAASNSGAREW